MKLRWGRSRTERSRSQHNLAADTRQQPNIRGSLGFTRAVFCWMRTKAASFHCSYSGHSSYHQPCPPWSTEAPSPATDCWGEAFTQILIDPLLLKEQFGLGSQVSLAFILKKSKWFKIYPSVNLVILVELNHTWNLASSVKFTPCEWKHYKNSSVLVFKGI